MYHYERVCAEIDLDAVCFNVEQMQRRIKKTTKIMAVVKTDAYGHGAIPIATVLEKIEAVYGFATATVEEAFALRARGIQKPILVLGYTFPSYYEEMVKQEITATIFRLDMAEQMAKAAKAVGKKLKVHIKVDTGMSRIGVFPTQEGIAFISKLSQLPELEIEGIFTHFAKSDYADLEDARKQLLLFQMFVERAEQECKLSFAIKHAANSAAILQMPEANLNVVRAGIILYGLWPSAEVSQEGIVLKPVLSLKSQIVLCKEVEPGTPISYGGIFCSEKKMRIATIPIGYGDGYPRALSDKGYVLIHGKKAPILGRICMDQFMVDVTEIPAAIEGTQVVLIGTSKGQCLTMEELGEIAGGFNYEIACNIGKRIPRIYQKDGRIVEVKDYF